MELYTFNMSDTPTPLTREAAVELLPEPLKIQEKLEQEFKSKEPARKPENQGRVKVSKPGLPPRISGTAWRDDPNIQLLNRYFGLPDLDNSTAKKLERIVDYAVHKGATSQRDLLKTISAIERQTPRVDKDNRLSLVYRYIMLEGEE